MLLHSQVPKKSDKPHKYQLWVSITRGEDEHHGLVFHDTQELTHISATGVGLEITFFFLNYNILEQGRAMEEERGDRGDSSSPISLFLRRKRHGGFLLFTGF